MKIDKEELHMIITEQGYPARFLAPIHPRLLDKDIFLDRQLPYQLFRKAQTEAMEQVRAYLQTLPQGELRKGLESFSGYHNEPLFLCTDTGFARTLSTRSSLGGSLIFESKERSQQTFDSRIFHISEEKLSQWCIPGNKKRMYAYQRHNVDGIPNTFLLQTWARLYVNAALEQLL